jgi:hypothetical protein
VGGVSGPLVVPKANAQQAATLTNWEYTCLTGSFEEVATAKALNPYGQQGWELQALSRGNQSTSACFKRPKM